MSSGFDQEPNHYLSLKEHWENTWIDNSLQVFEQTLLHHEQHSEQDNHLYASSGCGKSKLLDTNAKHSPTPTVTIGQQTFGGFPPSDE